MDSSLFIHKMIPLISSALSLVTSLAWNEAIKDELKKYPSLKKYGNWAYAIIITIISSLIIFYLTNHQ